jgi:methylenetetrahydrofolate dehydrogenase (NADP+) / methenyltetrahydrofolate cyclohydrolase
MAREGARTAMPAIIYDSGPLAERMREALHHESLLFRQRCGRQALLVQIIVGHDDAAYVYSRQLQRACRELELECVTLEHPFAMSEEALRAEISTLNDNPENDGVVLLLPLPDHIRQRQVTEVLRAKKDVDGLGPRNAGNLMLGFPSFMPSTADAILSILQDADISVAGRNAVVVGRSNIGGKPAGLVLLRLDATVTICHSHTPNLAEITRNADILVSSVGRAGMITGEMVKPGAVVLDAGINMRGGKVVGDVDMTSVREIASFITPVPGGLGPLTHLTLIRHTLHGPQ